jgi:hypothetical protein
METHKFFALTSKQCDGCRPSCMRCARENVMCEYNVEPDTSRLQSLRRKNDALETELDLLRRLIDYIRTRSIVEAQEAVQQLRACDDPLEVAKLLST